MDLPADKHIVLARLDGSYTWFVSERDYWVLDWDSWEKAFVEAGHAAVDPGHAMRWGVAVVDRENAAEFLQRMAPFAVSLEELREYRLEEDGCVVHPSLFVDFDDRTLHIGEVDSPAFDEYMPPGWKADFAPFVELLPEELRYW
ncbi:hypothetical protein [Nannocystis radixulma]|uniref:Uncharacterized protein n=1 Tax=Nannocystis radixulma TaxID=2995305 RepID=A0ABT5BH56_9BACT|nr:hypothetical protein [Nannocystis radixulma]MDC0673486.1 hypothetical protein [Nannocystis radixulma]